MKTVLKIIAEIIGGFVFLFGLYKTSVITSATAITVGLLSFLFILCFEEVKKQLYPMSNAMAEMQKFLGEKLQFVPLHEMKPAGYVQEQSPLQNTELGLKLLNESGARKIIDDNYVEFEKRIEARNCSTAYDVQSESSRIIAEAANEPYMKPIKDFVYQHPKFYELPLTLSDAQRVMVVYLRDLFLGKHPAILPDDEPKKS